MFFQCWASVAESSIRSAPRVRWVCTKVAHFFIHLFYDLFYVSFFLFQIRNRFLDTVRIQVRGGSGGQGLPKIGGHGGRGGDVWLVGSGRASLKQIIQKCPTKRVAAGSGSNSR